MKRMSKRAKRVRLTAIGMAVISTGLMGWVLTTNPPAGIVLGIVLLLGWPVGFIAYQAGYVTGLAWAAEQVEGADA